jgi:hypothetical protein
MTDCRIYGTLPCVSRLLFVSVEMPSRTNVKSTNTTLEQLAKWPSVRDLMAGRAAEKSPKYVGYRVVMPRPHKFMMIGSPIAFQEEADCCLDDFVGWGHKPDSFSRGGRVGSNAV